MPNFICYVLKTRVNEFPEDTVEVCPAWTVYSVRRSAAATSRARHLSRPWCGGYRGMGSRHLLLLSSNASEGGGVTEAGVASNFRFPTPPPQCASVRPRGRPSRRPRGRPQRLRDDLRACGRRAAGSSPSDQDQARVDGTLCSTRVSKSSQLK